MPNPPEPDEIAKLNGKTLEVADLLSMFNATVRDQAVVLMIRTALETAGLTTVPSFASAARTDEVHVLPLAADGDETQVEQLPSPVPGVDSTRVAVLLNEEQGIVSVEPGTALSDATTLMMTQRLAQLPVMSSDSVLLGMVTWRSIWAAQALQPTSPTVEDALERDDIPTVHPTDKLLTALDQVRRHGYVLVRSGDGRYVGLVTHTDVAEHFSAFAAPFFAIGEIERRLRTCLERHFDENTDLPCQGVRAKSFEEFTLGSYERFLIGSTNWQKLGWQETVISQQSFLALLGRARGIRNDVMHFNPRLLTDRKQQQLDEFAGLLQLLVP
jgi:CBS domain-containing protein